MIFDFHNPAILILFPLAATYILLVYRGFHISPRWKKRAIPAFRLAVLLLLVLALSGFGIKTVTGSVTGIFLVDTSDSCLPYKAVFERLVKDAADGKKPDDSLGVICFGKNAEVEQVPSHKPDFSSFLTKIDGSCTNIEQAMKLASSLMPADGGKKVILVSDGAENSGNALEQARLMKQRGISVDVVPFAGDETGEVQVREIGLPETMKLGQHFEVTVKIRSTANTKGVLKLFADRTMVAEKRIDIQKGDNNYLFQDTAKTSGLVAYSAEVDPDYDRSVKNNKLSAFAYIEGTPRLLIVQDNDGQGAELSAILGGEADIRVVRPENVPTTVSELQKYDAFLLCNIPAGKLDERFLGSLEACVRLQGKGLLVTGGDNSYAPGGYSKTVLEKILPVSMDIRPKKEEPNLGLMLVIDKSDSMSQGNKAASKIDLAKEAAIRSTEVLNRNDEIGVITFDTSAEWVVPMQKPTDLEKIQAQIGTIRAGGGTLILKPLDEAYKALTSTDTKLRHILLLTDGKGERTGYENFILNINKAKITLSTVAVGKEADKALLRTLAEQGGGRYYETSDPADIPRIFTRETIFTSNRYLVNRTFAPSASAPSVILKDINEIPVLKGYVGTTAKASARIILKSDMDDPILASWQYGLGRTAAWTSDAAGMWTGSFLKWDMAPLFWRNTVSWLIGEKAVRDYSLRIVPGWEGQSIELSLPPDNANTGEKAVALLTGPYGEEKIVELSPTSPGNYKGSLESGETGAYTANIRIVKNGETIKTINTSVIMPYSREYDITDEDSAIFLGKLAQEGGGKMLGNTGSIFDRDTPAPANITDMTHLLLGLAIPLLLIEIILRRFHIALPSRKPDKKKTGNKSRNGSVKPVDTHVAELLRKKKNMAD